MISGMGAIYAKHLVASGTPIFEAKIVGGTYFYMVPPLYARKLLKSSKHIFKKSKIPGSAQFQGVKSKVSPESPLPESSLVEALIFPEGKQAEAKPVTPVLPLMDEVDPRVVKGRVPKVSPKSPTPASRRTK